MPSYFFMFSGTFASCSTSRLQPQDSEEWIVQLMSKAPDHPSHSRQWLLLNHLLLQLHSGRTTSPYFQPDDSLPCIAGDPNQQVQIFWNLIVNAERQTKFE
jgi:hypothetical protein